MADIRSDFPHVDWSLITDEEDTMWDKKEILPDERSSEDCARRALVTPFPIPSPHVELACILTSLSLRLCHTHPRARTHKFTCTHARARAHTHTRTKAYASFDSKRQILPLAPIPILTLVLGLS